MDQLFQLDAGTIKASDFLLGRLSYLSRLEHELHCYKWEVVCELNGTVQLGHKNRNRVERKLHSKRLLEQYAHWQEEMAARTIKVESALRNFVDLATEEKPEGLNIDMITNDINKSLQNKRSDFEDAMGVERLGVRRDGIKANLAPYCKTVFQILLDRGVVKDGKMPSLDIVKRVIEQLGEEYKGHLSNRRARKMKKYRARKQKSRLAKMEKVNLKKQEDEKEQEKIEESNDEGESECEEGGWSLDDDGDFDDVMSESI